MRLLQEIFLGMVTQRPQGGPLDYADVVSVQWLQRTVGGVLFRGALMFFSGSLIGEALLLFI
jgi:hypothetical protein